MTEKQKKLAIIAGVIIVALILLFSSRKAGSTIINQEAAPKYEVSMPGLNMPVRSPIAINIPGLPSFTPYSYNAISPCMCDGGAFASSQSNSGPLVTFVTNQGNAGPNVYNYGGTTTSNRIPIYCPDPGPGRTALCVPGTIVSYRYI